MILVINMIHITVYVYCTDSERPARPGKILHDQERPVQPRGTLQDPERPARPREILHDQEILVRQRDHLDQERPAVCVFERKTNTGYISVWAEMWAAK